MQTYYFNTGVEPHKVINFPYDYHKEKGNVIRGTLLIPFDCEDVPENARFLFATDVEDMNVLNLNPDITIKREIHNSNMVSKYVYFQLNTPKP
jgi:hypothetical protein